MDFARSRCPEDLESDLMLQFALVRAVEIVGEAAARVSEQTRVDCPDIPWAPIIGMRNRLVHAYFDINPGILWAAVTEEIPALARLLAHQLDQE
jgi:uncharacterized protein with HEPN domain